MASAAIFCPQSKAPGEQYLQELHSYLYQNQRLEPLVKCVLGLKEVWDILAKAREDIASLGQWPQGLQIFSEWMITGQSSQIALCMSGITSLPLLVVIQTCQYFQYLEICGMSHHECVAHFRSGGGIQGYCGGLLTAIAIACSRDEDEVVTNAATAIRVALAIGACGELGDDISTPGATTIVVRTQYVGQGDELTQRFPGSYISAITDPKNISIVGSAAILRELSSYARENGLLVQEMHIRGKVHNPENFELAQALCLLCDEHEMLQLPRARDLQALVRSNKTGDILVEGSLTNELVSVILASRCEWYTLLTKMARDLELSGRRNHTFATFGIGDCTPLSPFHKVQLRISKVDVQSLIAERIASQANRLQSGYTPPQNAIAIIGSSCRLPGASNMEELWDLISTGQSRHEELPTDRFDLKGSFRVSQDNKAIDGKRFFGNFVDQVDHFDHAFFHINPKEAMNMDPQQRVLLELAYQAMDSSGYLASHRRESEDPVGCFIGASFAEYLDNTNAYPATAYTSTGTIRAFLCGRISHYFGWRGPSEVLDTACSSSLVAINRACKAIQGGECDMALAGGINLITGINNFLDLSKAGFLSSTGQCKPFDEAADGYCRSEGGGLVVLKLLSQALADGDHILGVIPGIGTNQGGLSSSITVPHAPAQKNLYQTVLDQANMKAGQVTYVEAHGTGTQAGDPVEIASIREVFGAQDRANVLSVGSLKGNIGHTETAAGVASLLKIVTMITKTNIPPQASHKLLNRKIPPLEKDKLCIPSTISRWQAPLLAACVNSYGAAGSNCAMICCENPRQKTGTNSLGQNLGAKISYPIIISAASQESLLANIQSLRLYLQRVSPKPDLQDVAFTLDERRQIHSHRFVMSTCDIEDLTQQLELNARSGLEAPKMPKRVVLAFGGQGSRQYLDRRLYDSHPRLRDRIDECEKILKRLGYPTIMQSLFQPQPINEIVASQCGTFVTQYAYAKCWIDAGLHIDAIVGHSFGELTGMVVSGVLSLRDGLKLVASRASLMATNWGHESGTMLSIHSALETVQAVVAEINAGSTEPVLEIACYNAPSSHVIVGNSLAVIHTEQLLRRDPRFMDVRSQRLDVSRGFHSKFTEPILDEIDQISASLTFSKPKIPLETCTQDPGCPMSAMRPSQHTREPVFFHQAIGRLEERLGPCVWLEAGLGSPVIPMVKRALNDSDAHSFQTIQLPDSQTPTETISKLTSEFWREGISVSYWNFMRQSHNTSRQVFLPPYQFKPTSHWLKNIDRTMEVVIGSAEKVQESKAPLKLVNLVNDTVNGPSEFSINLKTARFSNIVSGHAVRQRPLCPASMYMECAAMGLQLIRGPSQRDNFGFSNLSFQAPLGVGLERDVSLVIEQSKDSQRWSFSIKSISGFDSRSKASTHAKGTIIGNEMTDFETYQRLIVDRITDLERKPTAENLMSKRAYGLFSQVVHYADFLRGISRITMDKNEAIANIEISEEAHFGSTESSVIQKCDTVAIDTFIQVVGLLINSSALVEDEKVYVATGLDRAVMSPVCDFHGRKSWKVYAKYTSVAEGKAAGDIFVMTSEGTLAMMITGAQFTKILITKLEKLLDEANKQPSENPAMIINSKVKIPVDTGHSPKTSTIVEGIKRPLEADYSNLVRSIEVANKDATLAGINERAENRLRCIIAEYTGLFPTDIAPNINMSNIGVDSLAAVELAEELQKEFGKDVAAEDVLASSFKGLLELLIPHAQVMEPALSASRNSGVDFTSLPPSSSCTPSVASSCVSSSSSRSDLNVSDAQERVVLESLSEPACQGSAMSMSALRTKVLHKTKEQTTIGTSNESGNRNTTRDTTIREIDFTSPTEALAHCERVFDENAAQRGFQDYWAVVAPQQDDLLLAYICEAFQALGLDLARQPHGEPIPPLPHQAKHERVVSRLLAILEKHELLIREGSAWVRSAKQTPSFTSQDLHERFLERFPLYGGEARLMALTGPNLADCLLGKVDPLTLLFRGVAAQKTMEDYYSASPMLSTLTEQLVKLVSTVITYDNYRARETPIRILEVGAGFGGTTKLLAQAIEAIGVPVTYTFSDISPSLVQGAKAKFSKFPWMKFQLLNLENEMPPSLQNTYDIVIGTNCVHATTDKTKTISRLKSALKPRGFIVLSEVTQMIDWYDLVFGLLDGWWLAKDGSTYPIQPADKWVQCFLQAGFSKISYSRGQSLESNTQRLFVASNKEDSLVTQVSEKGKLNVITKTYKEVDGTKIEADIYLPARASSQAMPIALMIHGGGYMTLSRKAIRPQQTSLLLEHNVLPVSIDYRLCPEIDMVNGPITDVYDAYIWAQTRLQSVVCSEGILVDEKRIVVVGWSSGGHLAMSVVWNATAAGNTSPIAILSFYGPTDFESGDLDDRQTKLYPEQFLSVDEIISALPDKPITSHTITPTSTDKSYLGWLQRGDPRSELVLSLFKNCHGLPLLLNGIHAPNGKSWSAPASKDLIASISPISHVRRGNYTTPTFLVHGTQDEVVPFDTAIAFSEAMKAKKVKCGLSEVKDARHMHDLNLKRGDEGFWEGVELGYQFLFEELERGV